MLVSLEEELTATEGNYVITKEHIMERKDVLKDFKMLFSPGRNEAIWTAYISWLQICLNIWKDDHDPCLKGIAAAIENGEW